MHNLRPHALLSSSSHRPLLAGKMPAHFITDKTHCEHSPSRYARHRSHPEPRPQLTTTANVDPASATPHTPPCPAAAAAALSGQHPSSNDRATRPAAAAPTVCRDAIEHADCSARFLTEILVSSQVTLSLVCPSHCDRNAPVSWLWHKRQRRRRKTKRHRTATKTRTAAEGRNRGARCHAPCRTSCRSSPGSRCRCRRSPPGSCGRDVACERLAN